MNRKNIYLLFCPILVSFVIGVDINYISGSFLRTQDKKVCYSGLYDLHCKIKCGAKSSLCIEKLCYCVFVVKGLSSIDGPQMIYLAKPGEPIKEINLDSDVNTVKHSDILHDGSVTKETKNHHESVDPSAMFSLRPALRHHIAHFCPNLDVARECIRTCMKEGKPAFCGKDHVCYCGHKYSYTDDNSKANVEETYGQFRDLYEKYFGTGNYLEKQKEKHE